MYIYTKIHQTLLNIIGTYECKADVKGRLMFPVSFKNQLAEILEQGFVIKRSIFEKCLELYPANEWENESAKINMLNRFNKKNVDFIRKFMAGVKTVKLDSTGRLLIPKDLINYGEIKNEIVLASVVNKIEIWDKAKYEQSVDYDPDEFGKLAEEVMGNSNTETTDK